MVRSPEIPLILWICAAVCTHFVFAEGGDQVATYHEDRSYLFQLGTRARYAVHGRDQTIDIITSESGEQPTEPEPEKPKKPEPPKEEKKPEPPKTPDLKIVVKPDDPLKKLDQVPLKPDSRIAVK